MKPIPKLELTSRLLISKGSDFVVFRLKQNTKKHLLKGVADRVETWLRVPNRKLKSNQTVENYVTETFADGTSKQVFFWQDNWRLAKIDGFIYELIESKSVTQWR